MPGGNRRGPMGAGPQTGRAAGYCAGFDAPGCLRVGAARGGGQGGWRGGRQGAGRGGGGGGRGWRHRHQYVATGLAGWQRASGWGAGPWPETGTPAGLPELERLKAQATNLEHELTELRARLAQLESSSPSNQTAAERTAEEAGT